DEIFGGYASYSALMKGATFRHWKERFLLGRQQSINLVIEEELNRRRREIARDLFTEEFEDCPLDWDVRKHLRHYDNLATYDHLFDARLFLDLMVFLSHTPSLGDTTGMASSIESRSPFLDRHVMEFAAALPQSFKVRLLRSHKYNK